MKKLKDIDINKEVNFDLNIGMVITDKHLKELVDIRKPHIFPTHHDYNTRILFLTKLITELEMTRYEAIIELRKAYHEQSLDKSAKPKEIIHIHKKDEVKKK